MRRFSRLLLVGLLAVAGAASGADDFPNRPIRLVVPFPAGGTLDVIARTVANALEPHMKQTFVVDNRAGANGIIGYEILAKAPADGYTQLLTTPAMVINPSMYRKVPYDVEKDFTPITNVAMGVGYFLVVHPSVPANSTAELIALARKRPDPLTYSSPGVGNTLHLAAAVFNAKANARLLHIPYKGVAPAMNALLAGEVQLTFIPPTIVMGHIKSGRVRALGFTGAQRWQYMPDIPTIAESGLPGFTLDAGWQGWFLPGRASPALVKAMHGYLTKALENTKLREALSTGGYEPLGNSPEEFRRFVSAEVKKYADVIRTAGIKPE